MKSKKETMTLAESDISSERSVDRRSLLGTLGLGVGAAAAAVLGGTGEAKAADQEGRGRRCIVARGDRDPNDPVIFFRDRDRGDRSTTRNCTDND